MAQLKSSSQTRIDVKLNTSAYRTQSTTAQAQAGTNTTTDMSPARVKEAITALPAIDILNKIKTVDGVGSGLNADLLAGVPGAGFLRSDVVDSASALLTFTGGIALPTVLSGLTFGNASMYVSGDSNHIHVAAPIGLIPASTITANNSDLGTGAYRWKGVYAGVGDFAGNLAVSGTSTLTGETRSKGFKVTSAIGTGDGISLYGGASSVNPTYGLMFAKTINKGNHGFVSGNWATYFTMSTTPGRGWIFTTDAVGIGGNVASISNAGDATFNNINVGTDKRLIFQPNTTWGASLSVGGLSSNVGPTQASIAASNGNLHIDAATGFATYLNWYGGAGGTIFGNGASAQVAKIDSLGNATFNTVNGVRLNRDIVVGSGTAPGYPNLRGGFIAAGPAATYQGALSLASGRGSRLPTLEELKAGLCKATGGGYDALVCWTCTSVPGQPGFVYGILGTGAGTPVVLNTDGSSTAATRVVTYVTPQTDLHPDAHTHVGVYEPVDTNILRDTSGISAGSTISTIVKRNNSGDINTRLFRSEYTPTNASIGAIMTQITIGGVNTNNYIRPSTPAQVVAALPAIDILNSINTVDGSVAEVAAGRPTSVKQADGTWAVPAGAPAGAGAVSSSKLFFFGQL